MHKFKIKFIAQYGKGEKEKIYTARTRRGAIKKFRKENPGCEIISCEMTNQG